MLIYLALGANEGDSLETIYTALDKIEERIGHITALSSLYKTLPQGFVSANEFVNAVCEIDTHLSPSEILACTEMIEREAGRKSKSKNQQYSDRPLDIDVILAGDVIINRDEIEIPHPRMHQRDFVLVPLVEIAPHAYHPIYRKTAEELLKLLDQETEGRTQTIVSFSKRTNR